MQNLSIKEIESLLLASDQEDILKTMAPKSQGVKYMRLMQKLCDSNLSWSILLGEMKSFEVNRKFDHRLRSKVETLRLVKSVENAADDVQRKKALEALNKKWFNYDFSYPRPAAIETRNLDVDIQSGNEEQTIKENKQLSAVQTALDAFRSKPSLTAFRKLNPRYCLLGLDFADLG